VSVSLRLSSIDFDVVNAARRVLEGSLGLVPGESVLLLLDEARKDLAPAFEEVTRSIGATPVIQVLEDLGTRPARSLPTAVAQAMDRVQASVLLVGFHEGEQPMRAELIHGAQARGLRHAHMVGVTRRSLLAGFSVDPSRIVEASRAVRLRLRPDSRLRLRSPAGSDLEVTLHPSHRWLEHVGAIRPGRWENLPAGELVTAPRSVDGVFVADGSIGGHVGAGAGLLAHKPIRIELEGGAVKNVSCFDLGLKREVESFLRRERGSDRVGTVIVGTNVGIVAPVGEPLCDQNVPGLHLGLGASFHEQTGAPPTTRLQLTLTGGRADLDLDGVPIVRSGRYMIG
jgi:leucyl aminopeptidase (aminopeptidase T)